jgi:alpha-tubulin suppressor-like RCC1 family protein
MWWRGRREDYHSLFVTTDGTLWAMGYNFMASWATARRATFTPTTPISVASNVVAVAAGTNHSLFVDTNGTLWAMGYNGYGQLGNGTTTYPPQHANQCGEQCGGGGGGIGIIRCS